MPTNFYFDESIIPCTMCCGRGSDVDATCLECQGTGRDVERRCRTFGLTRQTVDVRLVDRGVGDVRKGATRRVDLAMIIPVMW
mgnify:CR=1 FL=1